MKHVLICGAAGFTNLGDDAILWGMLTQLGEAAPGRPVVVAGGPELAGVTSPFGARALSYEARAELARAIEDAALVVLGGGGMLYDFGYDADLRRFLTDPPDRQWLYELAKIAAAARAAGRPVMLYGAGAGPLHTEAARRAARFLCEQAQAITVRDCGSREVLGACGVPPTRVHISADPAVVVEPAATEAADAVLGRAGAAGLPRPWVAVNLRPWYRFAGPESAAEERGDELDRLIARAGALIRGVRERLGGAVLLLPLQRMYDDDRVVLERAAAAAEGAAVTLEPPTSPPELAALMSRCDLVVAMRLHALVLALSAGTPFLAISYGRKVEEFAAAAGLGEHVISADDLDVERALSSCERLLSDRASAAAALAGTRSELREAARLSAELAGRVLAGDAAVGRAHVAHRVAPAAGGPEAANPRVLMQTRPDYRERPGGDVLQLEEVQRALRGQGVTVDLSAQESPDLGPYDLVHTINLDRPEEAYRHCLNALAQGRPIALSPVHTDMSEFMEWGDPDYWHLPDPAEGAPEPRPAPPQDPIEERRRALRHLQRQLVVDWATVYLPNAQSDAEYLSRTFGMDLTRTVVVPHGVRGMFFEARPERFVARYGLRDFVMCAGRVETRKNQLGLVAALRGTGISLVIVGQANPEEYRELCRRYADERVVFLDALPQEELASAYAAAKVHALPSWFEVPGLVSLEAAAAGCNVVSTDRGSARDYLGDMAWYCNPRDIGSIRAAVLAAYEAPRSERLREHIRHSFTWERAAERTLEGYRLAVAIHESRAEPGREAAAAAALRQHADWVARLAADRAYEAQRAADWAREAEEWARAAERRGRELEERLAELAAELDRVTSRRLYRLSAAVARAGWGVLRRLGYSRGGQTGGGKVVP